MLTVDTNVLIHAANSASSFHRPCRDWLDRQRERPEAWFVTWPIVYEFLRIVTHRQLLRPPWTVAAGWEFISSLMASRGFGILVATPRHAEVAAAVFAEIPHLGGNIVHDAHTAILMREHGIARICTRDTNFHHFPFLEVIDPVRA